MNPRLRRQSQIMALAHFVATVASRSATASDRSDATVVAQAWADEWRS